MQDLNVSARIPLQSKTSRKEPVFDSFPPGEAVGAAAPMSSNKGQISYISYLTSSHPRLKKGLVRSGDLCYNGMVYWYVHA